MEGLKEHSEKEKVIFKGVVDLLNQGHGIHELKVADIAAAAGIGKSTVYEYFSTKEEIIQQALSYHIYREFEGFTRLVSNQDNFTTIIIKIMDYSIEMLKTRFSSLLFMVLNLGQTDIKRLIKEDNDLFLKIRSGVNDHIEKMYHIGKKDKLIGEDTSLEDCGLVLFGIISAFINDIIFMRNKAIFHKSAVFSVGLSQDHSIKEDSLADLKERSIKLILKALK